VHTTLDARENVPSPVCYEAQPQSMVSTNYAISLHLLSLQSCFAPVLPMWHKRHRSDQVPCCSPDHQAQVSLAGVDGVGYRQVVDNPLLPVLLGPFLPCQAVIEAGQAWALKGSHPQDVLEEDSTAGGREATQRMTCTQRGTVIMCWTGLHLWKLFVLEFS